MEPNNEQSLSGKRVAVLMTDGVEQIEYTEPRSFLERQGARVTLIAPKDKGEQVQGFNHLQPGNKFTVEMHVGDAKPGDFDALVLPGGVANPDQLRLSVESIRFIRNFGAEDKPIAAICHGPWTLIDAGLAKRLAQCRGGMDRRPGGCRRQARYQSQAGRHTGL
jgi:protease I